MARAVPAGQAEADALAGELVKKLAARSLRCAAAESCTAGLVADLVARIPGASAVFWGSFVAYTPEAKEAMLGVKRELIERCGAVSGETACAMARGALERSGAHLAVAVTGLAGPGGDGGPAEPGMVWFALARRGEEPLPALFRYRGSRNEVRRAAAREAVALLLRSLT